MKESKLNQIMEDIEKNHNWSWFEEIYNRNKSSLDKVALFYRGTKITYGQMFNKMFKYAKSLKSIGIKKGNEVPICISNTPEFVYLMGAISIIGAKANIFGEGFDKEYIKQIVNKCDTNVLFTCDNKYLDIMEAIPKKTERIVMFSLNDSLPNHEDPFIEVDRHYFDFKNHVEEYKKDNNIIMNQTDFENLGLNLDNFEIIPKNSGLDDEFTITYSSGTTNTSRPKGIVHTNRSYITMARFHDSDIPGNFSMENLIVLASIPTLSNTNFDFNISESLMQKSIVALEPVYSKDFLLTSLKINKVNVVVTSKSFIVYMMKNLPSNCKLPYLIGIFAAGEATSKGEEKFVNAKLRQLSAGSKKYIFPLSPVPLSIAGGDCEHGGFYLNVFKRFNDMLPMYKIRKEESGVKPLEMVEFAVLDNNGDYCKPYQLGKLVANSPCTMKEYKNNPAATDSFFIKDKYGKKWGDCKVFSYYDCYKRLHIKGRYIDDPRIIPPHIISDVILNDTKKILSCEVIPLDINNEIIYVAHIEFQPSVSANNREIQCIEERLIHELGNEVTSKIVYRIRGINESYPLTPCGKRNNNDLIAEGISDVCVKPVISGKNLNYVSGKDYLFTKKLILK